MFPQLAMNSDWNRMLTVQTSGDCTAHTHMFTNKYRQKETQTDTHMIFLRPAAWRSTGLVYWKGPRTDVLAEASICLEISEVAS